MNVRIERQWARAAERANTAQAGLVAPPRDLAACIARLPPHAAEKLRRFLDARSESLVLARAASDARNEILEQKLEIERQIERSLALPRAIYGDALPAEGPELQRLRARLETVEAELRRREERLEARGAQAAALGNLVQNNLARQVERIAGEAAPYEGKTAAPGRNETPAAAVARVRRRREELVAERDAIRAAPRPVAEIKADLARQVERLAQAGRPNLAETIDRGGLIGFPRRRAEVEQWRSTDAGSRREPLPPSVSVPDAPAMFAWLFREDLLRACEREIDGLVDDASALGTAERRARETAIAREILAVEREEEDFVTAAEAAGVEIERRGDADFRAVLALADETPGPD